MTKGHEMNNVRKIKEIVVEMVNDVGIINDMTQVMVTHGIRIQAIDGSVEDGRAVIRIVTEDNLKAVDALRHKGYAPLEVDAILIELNNLTEVLLTITGKFFKAGIDIEHIYSAAGFCEDHCGIIVSCSDTTRAFIELTG